MPPPKTHLFIFILLSLIVFPGFGWAQRIFIPPNPAPASNQPIPFPQTTKTKSQAPPASSRDSPGTLVLKTYPDGTKKIVPLEALNFHDDGEAFGGPPRLSLYQEPVPFSPIQKSPERLSVAPIGSAEGTAVMTATLPISSDPLAGTTLVAAADPMGGGPASDPMGGGKTNPLGGSSASNPMGGAAASSPVDPLAGSAPKNAPPLQTVSGKPAPVVGDTTMVQLGEWEGFFFNGGIGGALQGQLTSRRIWNGTNRQAYPYTNQSGQYTGVQLAGENFTFQPGFRIDTEFGYNFYEWLGVGLQTGIVYNGLSQYNPTLSNGSGYHFSADGELVQVPIQLTGILRWPGNMVCRPFIGGGIGAIWQQLDVNNFYGVNGQAAPIDVQGNYCRSAFQFGWNAQVGLTYTVEPGLDFYSSFKMLSAFMPVIGNYQFENTYNFAIEVGVQSRF